MAAFQTSNLCGHPCSLVQTTEPQSQLSAFSQWGEMFNISVFGRAHFVQDGWIPANPDFFTGRHQNCPKRHGDLQRLNFVSSVISSSSIQKPMLMISEKRSKQNWYSCKSNIRARFSGSIYHLVLRQKIYCNTISDAAVDMGNFRDVQQ